ncbi:MAG: CBS domain-containing protein [Candidatus Rokubacteria bacterium]|nr:CBS domain-containing protein [Candidatus Rokubacteria bacterium]
MRAQDVMVRDPQTVGPETTVWTALALMRQGDIRHLPVTDDGGTLQGILSNRDFRRVLDFLDPEGRIPHVREIRVSDIMTKTPDIITAHPDTPLVNIAQLMAMRKVGAVPIVDAQHRVIGILTQKDVLRELVRLLAPPPLDLGRPA